MEIGKGTDGFTFLVEDIPSGILRRKLLDAVDRRLGAVRTLPLAVASLDFTQGDVILIGRRGNFHLPGLGRRLGLSGLGEPLAPGAYRVASGERDGRRALALLGGDTLGLLTGITNFTSQMDISATGIAYRGSLHQGPTLPYRCAWSWDHSLNWALDYPGQLDWGCENEYLQPPEAYVDNCCRQIDYLSEHGINTVMLFGFLRDAHNGVEAGQEICRYAKDRGVKVLPGVGVGYYGGFFYRGNHPFSIDRWLQTHPEEHAITGDPLYEHRTLCPSSAANAEWLREGTHWLFETFDIDGAYLEGGDLGVCHCERCKALRTKRGGGDTDYYKDMVTMSIPVIEEILKIKPDAWVVYCTYTGFNLGPAARGFDDPLKLANMGEKTPDFVRDVPGDALCQWSLSIMLRQKPVPMTDILEDGEPEAMYESPTWPRGHRPPNKRSVGYIHQASQWHTWPVEGPGSRYNPEISTIKEACMRAVESGLLGFGMHMESTARYVPTELNYLAFSHFSYNPKDSLRAFASAKLSPLVGGEEMAQKYIEYLAKLKDGKMTEGDRKELSKIARDFTDAVAMGKDWGAYRRWRWLANYRTDVVDPTL